MMRATYASPDSVEAEFLPHFERIRQVRIFDLQDDGMEYRRARSIADIEFELRMSMTKDIGPERALLAELKFEKVTGTQFKIVLSYVGPLLGMEEMQIYSSEYNYNSRLDMSAI